VLIIFSADHLPSASLCAADLINLSLLVILDSKLAIVVVPALVASATTPCTSYSLPITSFISSILRVCLSFDVYFINMPFSIICLIIYCLLLA